MKLIKSKNLPGFTLVESLLYVSIVSVMLGVISVFMFSLLQSQTKFKTISEVDQQGIQVVQTIKQAIRNSSGITAPAQGSSGSSLTLESTDSAKNPTVLNSSGTNVQIKEGTDSIVSLTNSKVSISGLSFSNLSKANTPGVIKFQFTLSYINLSGRNEYEYSKTFYGSTSLRFN